MNFLLLSTCRPSVASRLGVGEPLSPQDWTFLLRNGLARVVPGFGYVLNPRGLRLQRKAVQVCTSVQVGGEFP